MERRRTDQAMGGRMRKSLSSFASAWRNAPIFILASIPSSNLLP